MKPITLTMKAFGSFAKETTINFREFQNGLFLVVGDTGAGKTTIFDAIVFALYGVASGSNRKPEMMHSDYVDKSEKLFVKLVFEQRGKEYTVTRYLYFRKKSGQVVKSAELILPNEAPISVPSEVTARCTELLGLNAEQFRRIVMLAQGEFRKFLSADAKEKSEILGKLFDNSEYVRFQNLLEQSRDALKRQRAGYVQAVENQMNTVFQRPKSETPEDEVLYLPGTPELIANLDKLIAAEEECSNQLEAEKQKAQAAVDAISEQRGAAEGNNKLLETLAEAQQRLEELNKKQEEMEKLQREYERAEKALRQCVPQQEKWEIAQNRVRQTERAIQTLQQNIRTLEEQCATRQAEVDGDQPRKQRIDEINLEGKRLEDSLPQYDKLEETHRQREQAEKQLQTLSGELEQKQTEETEKKNTLTVCQSELAELENAGAEEISRKADYETAQAAVNEFGTIQKQVAKLRTDEGLLQDARQTLERLTAEASAAELQHHGLYQRFVSGQAGLLAEKLERELTEQGSAVCPVCGTEHRAGQPHRFAVLVDGTPKQEEVDAAKEQFEQAEQRRTAQHTEMQRQEEAVLQKRNYLVDRAQKVVPECESWEQLSAADYLAQASAHLNRVSDQANARYDVAKRQKKRQSELSEEQIRLRKELESLGGEIKQKTDAISQAKVQIAGLKEKENALREGLTFAGKSEASARLQELDKERSELQADIDHHQSALNQATEKLNNARGGLQEKEDSLPKQKAEEKEAQSTFVSALERNGFANADEMEAALAPIGREDGETWLNQQHKSLNEYRNDCENTRKRVAELTEQTKNLSYTNLAELNKKLEDAKDKRDADEKASSSQAGLLQNHRLVRRQVADARGELARTNKAWERLDRLAELAVGAKSDGGKLSFERYVMGSIFREVLDMANRRLDIMSGGHYELVHEMNAGRKNAAAGLEIEVLDVTTGKQRPANSLSGGESFQVSLSLALGLSDVVQSHAGGIGLDTVFIDEGFGALDGSALDSAITVLKQLTEGERLVGIISHVDKLEESIPQKLRVKKTAQGSELKMEMS